MRQILSGFLATAMIVSVASAMTFAATAPQFSLTMKDIVVEGGTDPSLSGGTAVNKDWHAKVELSNFVVELKDASSKVLGKMTLPTVTVEGKEPTTGSVAFADITIDAADIARAYNGKKFSNVSINNKLYKGTIVNNGDDIKIVFDDTQEIVGFDSVTIVSFDTKLVSTSSESTYDDVIVQVPDDADIKSGSYAPTLNGSVTPGDGKETSDVEITGDYLTKLGIKDVVWCYADGSPVPMAENPYGIDKDLNSENGSQSGTTLYFMINDTVDSKFADDTYWKLKITKGDNAKIIKKITDTTKTFNKTLYDAYNGDPITDVNFNGRHRFIKVELNELYTDDEYKCTLDLRMSPTSKAQSRYEKDGIAIEDAEIKVKDFYFWVKNIVKPADNDWKVGIGGLMLNPLENDWNEVTYFDEDGDLAFMKFFADSDVSKFYAKLSTKWEHADYASYFNDQDAYIFDFVGSPKISATSRCDLQIYNPFVNEDGDETIDPETAVIYQVIDGDLFDVTDNFTYQEGENGDMVFCTRTRFLGTYIICEKAVEEAADTEAPDTDLVPEQEPEEVAPGGSNDGGKAPANTGKYA